LFLAAVMREAARLRRRPRVGRREAERVERELDRARKAAVQIEEVDVGDTARGVGLRGARSRRHRRARRQVQTLGRAPAVLCRRAAEVVHAPLARDPETVRRRLRHHDHRRALVDLHDRVHELRIGEADPAVARIYAADLLGRARLRKPRERVSRRDLRVARQQRRDVALVRLDRSPGPRAQRILVDRVHLDGIAHAVALLEGVRERLQRQQKGGKTVAAWRPPGERHALFERAAAAVHGLGAAEQGDLDLAGGDPVRHLIEQQDRPFAAAGKIRRFARLGAAQLGDPARRIVVRPGERGNAAREVGLAQQLGPASVGGRALERRGHQPRGLERVPFRGIEPGTVPHLSHSDDHRALV
jgi:hypothetical protein